MEKRIGMISIIVEDLTQAEKVNQLLHEYGDYILGRMGLPYREQGVSLISVMLDAPSGEVNALAGKLGRIPGVLTKSLQTTK